MLHTLIGGIGTYLCARNGFKFSVPASFFTASLYIFSPKVAGFLEAGHYGLVVSFAWLPFVLLSTIMLARTPKFLWSAVLGIGLAAVFYTHTVIFILAVGVTLFTFIFLLVLKIGEGVVKKSLLFFTLGGVITLGLTAITLLPQIEWTSQTTRFLLLENRDVYPKWISKKEFVQSIFFPWSGGLSVFWTIDTEKWISLGLIPSGLAFLGFLKLPRKLQIVLTFLVAMSIVIALNNTSPLDTLLLSQDWYALMRVSTRIWFIPTFISIFLAGFGLHQLLKRKISRTFIITLVLLATTEVALLSWSRLAKPITHQTKYAPQEVYDFLKKDRRDLLANEGRFRVFCLNRCLSQQKAGQAGLELIEGYNTMLPKNYYQHMWQLSGGYWNYYTLALPPIGAYTYGNLQPDAASLGAYNTKYIISPYKLADINLLPVKEAGNYFVYQNEKFLTRAYFKTQNHLEDTAAPLLLYTPNHIRVDTSKHQSSDLILAEVYTKGWNAYLNGIEKALVQETPNSLRLVNIKSRTDFVDFKYEPESFNMGRLITISTLISLAIYFILKLKIRKL